MPQQVTQRASRAQIGSFANADPDRHSHGICCDHCWIADHSSKPLGHDKEKPTLLLARTKEIRMSVAKDQTKLLLGHQASAVDGLAQRCEHLDLESVLTIVGLPTILPSHWVMTKRNQLSCLRLGSFGPEPASDEQAPLHECRHLVLRTSGRVSALAQAEDRASSKRNIVVSLVAQFQSLALQKM